MACENGDIEIYNFPRADKATITYARDNLSRKWFSVKLRIRDMEEYISCLNGQTNLENIQDVMDVLTRVQESWKVHE